MRLPHIPHQPVSLRQAIAKRHCIRFVNVQAHQMAFKKASTVRPARITFITFNAVSRPPPFTLIQSFSRHLLCQKRSLKSYTVYQTHHILSKKSASNPSLDSLPILRLSCLSLFLLYASPLGTVLVTGFGPFQVRRSAE